MQKTKQEIIKLRWVRLIARINPIKIRLWLILMLIIMLKLNNSPHQAIILEII
jgi:hypothetical protein